MSLGKEWPLRKISSCASGNKSSLAPSLLSDKRQWPFPGVLALLLLSPPPAAAPVLKSYRQPTEGHPFKAISSPGTWPSLPDSRATSSAAKRLTAAQLSTAGPRVDGCVCLYPSCLCLFSLPLWGSIATQHCIPSALQTCYFLFIPSGNSCQSPQSLGFGHKAPPVPDELCPSLTPCTGAYFLCLECSSHARLSEKHTLNSKAHSKTNSGLPVHC